jgi:hypothetical protein
MAIPVPELFDRSVSRHRQFRMPSKRGLSRSRIAAGWRFSAHRAMENTTRFLTCREPCPANDLFFLRQNQKRLTVNLIKMV